jgi:hypothetical protein
MLEMNLSKSEEILQDIEDLGCRKFEESNVALKVRISCYRYKVRMGDRNYVERKNTVCKQWPAARQFI